MTDPVDIIETLRGIQCSNAACSNLRIAMGMKLAIYEIERLRAERDEARCELVDVKTRMVRLLSELQEYEAREQ
jgi:hypothetical protein